MLAFLNHKKYLILILILQLILGIKVIDYGHNWGGDFALYVDESRAIVEGRFWDFYQQNLFTNTYLLNGTKQNTSNFNLRHGKNSK